MRSTRATPRAATSVIAQTVEVVVDETWHGAAAEAKGESWTSNVRPARQREAAELSGATMTGVSSHSYVVLSCFSFSSLRCLETLVGVEVEGAKLLR